MRSVFDRSWLRGWTLPLVGAAIAVGVVLLAPLASPNPAGANVAITGAASLSDKVSVSFAEKPPKPEKPEKPAKPEKPEKTTDVHVLAFNDLHGTLDAGGQNLYGQFAGGAAFLAKAVKDRQAQYGDDAGDGLRRRQHRREPARRTGSSTRSRSRSPRT